MQDTDILSSFRIGACLICFLQNKHYALQSCWCGKHGSPGMSEREIEKLLNLKVEGCNTLLILHYRLITNLHPWCSLFLQDLEIKIRSWLEYFFSASENV